MVNCDVFLRCSSLVPRPHHARARKGSGDIGTNSWFCKLSNHVIICIGFLLAHVQSRDGAQDQENAPMSPDPFPRERLGSGNETSVVLARLFGACAPYNAIACDKLKFADSANWTNVEGNEIDIAEAQINLFGIFQVCNRSACLWRYRSVETTSSTFGISNTSPSAL